MMSPDPTDPTDDPAEPWPFPTAAHHPPPDPAKPDPAKPLPAEPTDDGQPPDDGAKAQSGTPAGTG